MAGPLQDTLLGGRRANLACNTDVCGFADGKAPPHKQKVSPCGVCTQVVEATGRHEGLMLLVLLFCLPPGVQALVVCHGPVRRLHGGAHCPWRCGRERRRGAAVLTRRCLPCLLTHRWRRCAAISPTV